MNESGGTIGGQTPIGFRLRPSGRPRLAALALLFSFALPATSASAAELTMRLCGMANRTGNLRIALFSQASAAAFTDGDSQAFALGVTLRLADAEAKDVLPVTVPLAPGKYAVRVIHDENANGVLDRGGIVGTPQEAYGYSLNARARVAAVEFDEASIEIGRAPMTIDIRVAAWSITGGDDSPCPP